MNWISVKDLMPTENQKIIMYGTYGDSRDDDDNYDNYYTGSWWIDSWIQNDREGTDLEYGGGFKITHWMPLPAKPKKEDR